MKTMRNTSVKLYTFLFILSALIVSCQKEFLDTKVDNSLTDVNVKSDYNTIFQFANAPYVFLNYESNGFNAIDSNLFAVCSDEAVQTSTGFRLSNIHQRINDPI
jgi:hypothetical protein